MPETTAVQEETHPDEAEETDETDDEPDDAEQEAAEEPAETKTGGGFFSPEGAIMILLAVFLDMAGGLLLFLNLAFPGASEAFSLYLDLAGLALIGGWMFFRSGAIRGPKGIKKLSTKVLKRTGLAFLGELIPFVGDIVPCWTIAVYYELKSD